MAITDAERKDGLAAFTQSACEAAASVDEYGSSEHWILRDEHFYREERIQPDLNLRAAPLFAQVLELLRSSELVARHLGRIVGPAGFGGIRVTEDRILWTLFYDQVGDGGSVSFSSRTFDASWNALHAFLAADSVETMQLMLLRGVSGPQLPFEISPRVSVVRFDDKEVGLLSAAQMFTAPTNGFPIRRDDAIGVRVFHVRREGIRFALGRLAGSKSLRTTGPASPVRADR